MNIKLLFRPGSLWIGAHWSAQNRQWCVNLIPCVTLRIRLDAPGAPRRGQKWVDAYGYICTVVSANHDCDVRYSREGFDGVFSTNTRTWNERFTRL